MNVLASIRDNRTGEVREHDTGCAYDDVTVFMWEDGNYSCDCNRAIFFGADEEDITCGDGRFSVALRDEHGTLYSEFEPTKDADD